MLIGELDRKASLDFLTRKQFGRLACSHEGQPYITPINFVHSENYLYSLSTIGRKIEWMRGNPLICIEADEIESAQKWSSVVVLGRYEELTKTAEFEYLRRFAWELLQQRPQWWEPGYAKTILGGTERLLEPVYFRIHIDEISGHQATPG